MSNRDPYEGIWAAMDRLARRVEWLERHQRIESATISQEEALRRMGAAAAGANTPGLERSLFRQEIDRLRAGKDAAEARAISLDTENEGLRTALKNQTEKARRLEEQAAFGDGEVARLQAKLADTERALRTCERANENQNRARERAEEQARMDRQELRNATYPGTVTALQEDIERLKQRIHEDREKLGRHAEERQAVAAAARQQERHRIWNEAKARFESGGGKAVKQWLSCSHLCDESPECVHVLRKEIGE